MDQRFADVGFAYDCTSATRDTVIWMHSPCGKYSKPRTDPGVQPAAAVSDDRCLFSAAGGWWTPPV